MLSNYFRPLDKQLLSTKCVLMQKVLHGKAPQYLKDLMVPSECLHVHGNIFIFYFAEGKDGSFLKLASPFQSLWHGTVHLPVSDTQYILITLKKKTFQAFISLL